jgi:thiol-disulfide isomerase/thioredoxin
MNYEQKYLKYKSKYLSLKNKKSMSGGGNEKTKVILFKADWCGHCKHFKPTWEAVSKQYNNKYEFIVYDADKQRDKFEEYKVDAFPTVMVKNGDKLMNYDGDRSVDDFTNFIQNID